MKCDCGIRLVCAHHGECGENCPCREYSLLRAFVRAWDRTRTSTKGPQHTRWTKRRTVLLKLRAALGRWISDARREK